MRDGLIYNKGLHFNKKKWCIEIQDTRTIREYNKYDDEMLKWMNISYFGTCFLVICNVTDSWIAVKRGTMAKLNSLTELYSPSPEIQGWKPAHHPLGDLQIGSWWIYIHAPTISPSYNYKVCTFNFVSNEYILATNGEQIHQCSNPNLNPAQSSNPGRQEV